MKASGRRFKTSFFVLFTIQQWNTMSWDVKRQGGLKTGEAHPLKRVSARVIKHKGVASNFFNS